MHDESAFIGISKVEPCIFTPSASSNFLFPSHIRTFKESILPLKFLSSTKSVPFPVLKRLANIETLPSSSIPAKTGAADRCLCGY